MTRTRKDESIDYANYFGVAARESWPMGRTRLFAMSLSQFCRDCNSDGASSASVGVPVPKRCAAFDVGEQEGGAAVGGDWVRARF